MPGLHTVQSLIEFRRTPTKNARASAFCAFGTIRIDRNSVARFHSICFAAAATYGIP